MGVSDLLNSRISEEEEEEEEEEESIQTPTLVSDLGAHCHSTIIVTENCVDFTTGHHAKAMLYLCKRSVKVYKFCVQVYKIYG